MFKKYRIHCIVFFLAYTFAKKEVFNQMIEPNVIYIWSQKVFTRVYRFARKKTIIKKKQ